MLSLNWQCARFSRRRRANFAALLKDYFKTSQPVVEMRPWALLASVQKMAIPLYMLSH